MENRTTLNIWGTGPKIMLPAAIFAVVALILTATFPEYLLMEFAPRPVFHILGGMITGFGLCFATLSFRAMKKALHENRLETGGTYSLSRNPMYFSWIFITFPGIAVTSQAWLLFGVSFAALYGFIKHIVDEEDELEKHFGQQFIRYRKEVPLLIPCKW